MRIGGSPAPGTTCPIARLRRPAALQIELAVDGLYELDFEQTSEMGRGALATARAVRRPALDRRGCVRVVPRRDRGRTYRRGTRAPRGSAARGRPARGRGAGTARSRRSITSAGPRPTSSSTTTRSRHFERGTEIARATGDGRLLVPMMLGKNFALEMQGRLAEAIECCETALEAARLSSSPHELYRALFELGLDALLLRRPRRRHGGVRGEPARRSPARRRDDSQRGRRPGLGARRRVVRRRRGRARAERSCSSSARTTSYARCRSSAASTGRRSTLAELAVGNAGAADAYARRAEEDAAQLGLQLPAALAGRARAAVLLAAGEPLEAARIAARSADAAAAVGAHASRRLLAQPPGARAGRGR